MSQTEEEKKKKEMEKSSKTKGRRVKTFVRGRREIERVDQITKRGNQAKRSRVNTKEAVKECNEILRRCDDKLKNEESANEERKTLGIFLIFFQLIQIGIYTFVLSSVKGKCFLFV